MYRPNYNHFSNNQQNNPNPRLDPQWNRNSTRDHYSPRRFNNHPFSQPYGINQGFQTHSNEYWCETCDRGFAGQILLENHKKQHQKCNIDGCQFIAHPKVITKHIQMQHSTGLYKKIAKLNNPEEIEKWREERRKKYPTKSNIDKKKLELQEKIERGEKMGLKAVNTQDGHKKRHRFGDKYPRKENKIIKRTIPSYTKKPIVPKKLVKYETDHDVKHLKPFAGVQQLIEDTSESEHSSPETSKDLIDDDEFVDNPNIISESKPVVCGALISLLKDYGSSDDEDLNSSKTIHSQKDCSTLDNTKENQIVKNNEYMIDNKMKTQVIEKQQLDVKIKLEDEDSGPEEIKVIKEVPAPTLLNSMTQTKPQPKFKKEDKVKMPQNSFKRKLPSTLLEKLLSSEIRQERNIVLQCIKYIIKNNYFDKDNK
ncbi:nuclear fragile X mental retardation-interacting protein 1 [Pieris rapae]|uniref:nuclear fragile X mental retardation-interacting protein 1 n=1 Tax=Pieris rapae TaxID=64459 RepID=UPI001E27C523|nr:nuclear fragile X mental retardation-interacting protein 1 [Pieris rapae]